jgi:hypothetical protein
VATAVFTNDWINLTARVMLRGATPPNPNEFYLALAATPLTRASSHVDCVAAELPATNGYQRVAVSFADGSYDTTDNRFEIPAISASWTAIADGFQFQSAFLIAGETIAAIINEDQPIALAPGQSHGYLIPVVALNTGYANGI